MESNDGEERSQGQCELDYSHNLWPISGTVRRSHKYDCGHFLSRSLRKECYLLYISLRTDTQLRSTLHFNPLGISLCLFVSQPFAFLVLETNNLREYLISCLK